MCDALVQHRSHVVDFQLGPRQPLGKVVPSPRLPIDRHVRPVVLDAALPKKVPSSSASSSLSVGVFAHGFVQPITDRATHFLRMTSDLSTSDDRRSSASDCHVSD